MEFLYELDVPRQMCHLFHAISNRASCVRFGDGEMADRIQRILCEVFIWNLPISYRVTIVVDCDVTSREDKSLNTLTVF